MKSAIFAVLTLIAMVLISGCTSQQTQDPADVVMKHLEARTTANADELRTLTCAAQESQVGVIANSLQGLDAKLKDAVCKFDGTSTVNCTGSIEINYQGELQQKPLKNYSVVQEDGQWKWCGEAK